MSATTIIVSFVMGTTEAAFCSRPMPLEQAQKQIAQIDLSQWVRRHAGYTPPNIIIRGHPNYTDALAGKVVDDPLTGESHIVAPCAPFQE